jgi:methylated-DNA-[protein]-cysteine S-methyltransferase
MEVSTAIMEHQHDIETGPVPIPTVAGVFRAAFSPTGLRGLRWPSPDRRPDLAEPLSPQAADVAAQLDAYFRGELTEFTIPLDMRGTPFQLRVWEELRRIPYGETRSYLEIALAVGAPEHVRAVGAANGSNPVPIIVPCHRVIGSDGKLVGFGGGLEWKRRLLDVEAAQLSLTLD